MYAAVKNDLGYFRIYYRRLLSSRILGSVTTASFFLFKIIEGPINLGMPSIMDS